MKNHSLKPLRHSRIRRQCAAALLLSCLGALTVSAQSTSGAGSTATDKSRAGSTTTGSSTTGSSSQRSSDLRSDSTRGLDTGSSLKRADRKFITKAAESSEKEGAIAQLAAERASSPDVRSFAQQLSSDHQKMHRELQQLAQRKGVTLDSVMVMSGAVSESSTNAGVASAHGAPRATGAAGTAGTGAATGIETNASTATSGNATAATAMRAAGVSADLASDRHYRKLAGRTGSEFDQEFIDMVVDHHDDDVRLFQKAAKDAQDSDVRSFASNHLASLQAHLDRANSLMRAAAE